MMFLIAIALAAAMPPERWVEVGRTGADREYIDRESVSRSGTKARLWTQRKFARKRGLAWNELELDCLSRTVTILGWVRDEGGTISHNVTRPHRAASPITPATTEEAIFKMVCR
jgi:hypothetical protein